MSWRGIFSGALVLIALEAVVRTDRSADRFGSMFTAVAAVVDRVMSPEVPAIPDLR